jgi:uncharacterized protein YndB with AHSA1/START domain
MDENAEEKTIVVTYSLEQTPDKVWRALTEPSLLAAWLMPNDIVAKVGHKFTFQAQPAAGWDGVVHCEVLIADAPRQLSYTWEGGSDALTNYGGRLESVVTWTLSETKGGGTWIALEHKGFQPKNELAFEIMGKGWRGPVGERMASAIAKAGS